MCLREQVASRSGSAVACASVRREGSLVTRTVFRGGTVFDGTMAPLAEADVVIEDDRIVEVGPGLDGDESVDCAGHTVLPGLFDTHTHVIFSTLDWVEELVTPFSFK